MTKKEENHDPIYKKSLQCLPGGEKRFRLAVSGRAGGRIGSREPDALAHLAWHELVETAEKNLPILVLNDSTAMTDVEKIKSCLTKMATRH